MEPAKYSSVAALRDGGRLEIRALRPNDRAALLAAVGQAGQAARRERGLGVRGADESDRQPDYQRRFGKADPKQLEQPAIATYYGLILAAAGQKEKARSFLARSAEATLLPEEKALVAKAQSNL